MGETKTVRIHQLIDYVTATNKWFKSNENNFNLALGKCIMAMSQQINELLIPYNELASKYGELQQSIKNKWATTVKVIENSQVEGHAVCEYIYSGGGGQDDSAIQNKNSESNAASKQFFDDRNAILNTEVEITPNFVAVRPASNILPANLEMAMWDIVIQRPEEKPVIQIAK